MRRTTSSPVQRRSIGRIALGLSITAAILSFVTATAHGLASGLAGVTRAADIDTAPGWYMILGVVFAIIFIVFVLCAVAGLISGIVAIIRDRGRSSGVIAVALAVLAPLVSLLAFILTAAIGAATV
ncbi:hypothetical protein DFO66_11673 [Brevibacterium sanguinis]|uniref:DUF4064 domain-containing protein n=2 Tax=Brevibacterium TaxID=1696 RepID=A0A366IIY0_9MICO|nr:MULTISPECIES: hypothetical protein [Brevibacterium]RBP62257.1 hypothetical protein DFO66_11673 [Brevibacterium sanguinis]RBP70611.1 hypothetical protein DFO65_10863 [Brevibacterium celere]